MQKNPTLLVSLLYLVLISVPSAVAAPSRPPIRDLVQKMDNLYRGSTSRGELEMTVETPDWKRTMDLKLWSEGKDKAFIVLLSPQKDAGIATLRVKHDMWNFFPRINKTLQVPPSMMMGSWMGSDFTNDDLVKESSLLTDYNARYVDEGARDGTWTVELVPKADSAVVWSRILMVIRADGFMPLREEYFNEHGAQVRVIRFSDVRTIGDRTLPLEMELTPLQKPGHRTVLKYKTLVFDQPLSPSIFSLQNLRQAR